MLVIWKSKFTVMVCVAVMTFFGGVTYAQDGKHEPVETREILYYLPKSELRIDLNLKVKTDNTNNTTTTILESGDISLVSSADTSFPKSLDPSVAALSNTKSSIKFRPDGRLESLDNNSTGAAATLIKSIFKGVVTAAGIAGRGFLFSASKENDDYKEAYPEQAELREKYQLQTRRLLELINLEIAKAEDANNDMKAVMDRVARLKDSLAIVRIELELLNQHYTSWKSSLETEETKIFSYQIDLKDLPKIDEINTKLAISSDPSSETFDSVVNESFRRFSDQGRFLIGIKKKYPDVSHVGKSDARNGADTNSIYYRMPYEAELCLYELGQGSSFYKATLKECEVQTIIDNESNVVMLPIKNRKFGKRQLIATFDANGMVSSIVNDVTSGAEDIASIIDSLPESLKTGLANANSILDVERELKLQGYENQIVEVKKQKELLLEQVALSEKLASSSTDQQIKNLENELKFLQVQKNIFSFVPYASTNESVTTLEAGIKLLELENKLAELQVRNNELAEKLSENGNN